MSLEKVQEKIGYKFQNLHLLKTSLVHRSYLNEKDKDEDITEHNERLEFLGDAVLELVVTEYLFITYPDNEGFLTALRASLVNYKIVGEIGNSLGLDSEILLSKGEKEELGKARLTIVADCVEAILGAMYLDGGILPCKRFIEVNVLVKLKEIINNQEYKDYKTLLQEFSQKHTKSTPYYKVISTEGKDHEKTFTIGVWIGGKNLSQADGKSKQDAETKAATLALKILQTEFIEIQEENQG